MVLQDRVYATIEVQNGLILKVHSPSHEKYDKEVKREEQSRKRQTRVKISRFRQQNPHNTMYIRKE